MFSLSSTFKHYLKTYQASLWICEGAAVMIESTLAVPSPSMFSLDLTARAFFVRETYFVQLQTAFGSVTAACKGPLHQIGTPWLHPQGVLVRSSGPLQVMNSTSSTFIHYWKTYLAFLWICEGAAVMIKSTLAVPSRSLVALFWAARAFLMAEMYFLLLQQALDSGSAACSGPLHQNYTPWAQLLARHVHHTTGIKLPVKDFSSIALVLGVLRLKVLLH
jgi:hypothetical protein